MPSLFSLDKGSGPPLVFLHGFCDTHAFWKEFVPAFFSTYRILAPDLPGFGRSDTLPSSFTIEDVGNAVASWIKDKALDKPIVIGHSLGGYVALSLMKHHSELLSGIGLVHSTPYGDSTERKVMRNKVIEFVRKNGVEPFVDTFVPGLFLDKSHPAIATTKFRALTTSEVALTGYAKAMAGRQDLSATLLGSELPAFMIAGVEDALIPIGSLRKLADLGKNLSLQELPKVAHMGVFEAKKQCQEVISKFAARVMLNKVI